MSLRSSLVLAALCGAWPCAAQQSYPGGADSTRNPAPDLPAVQAPMPDVAVVATPPDFPRGRISGYLVGDTYYNVSGDTRHVYTATGADQGQANLDPAKSITKDLNGVQVRRVYFQLDNDLSVRYATRVRFEVDGKALTSDGKIAPFVKNAYMLAKSVIPRGDLYFGVINTPTWENPEEFWGYRSIEKPIADFRGLASSSDLGIALKGFVDTNHRIGYTAMIGDGNGQKPETDRFKKFYASLPIRLGDLRIEPYADYQALRVNLLPRAATNTDSLEVNNDQATWKLFAGYEFRRMGLGAEGLVRVNHRGPAATTEPRGVSLFARGTLTPTVAVFARVDHWISNQRASNRVDSRLWIAGLDWQPYKDVHIMPNVEAMQYLAKGTAVAPAHHDLQARVTFYYRFAKPQS